MATFNKVDGVFKSPADTDLAWTGTLEFDPFGAIQRSVVMANTYLHNSSSRYILTGANELGAQLLGDVSSGVVAASTDNGTLTVSFSAGHPTGTAKINFMVILGGTAITLS